MNIAVTMRVEETTEYAETRDALSHEWTAMLLDHSALPILVPNTRGDATLYLSQLDARGLILTGGEDVGPETSESSQGSSGHLSRDDSERALLRAARSRGIPVLGVCRGLQLINCVLGGAIRRGDGTRSHVGVDHAVTVRGALAELVGVHEGRVNSFHSNVIAPEDLGDGLVAVALASDGTVEAVKHRDEPLLGVQWHPERPGVDKPLGPELIGRWLSTCV